jgi:hypothetical protein
MDDPDEVIAMQLTCRKCGRTVKNDFPRSQMPTQIAFNDHLRSAGWKVHHNGSLCLKCVSS